MAGRGPRPVAAGTAEAIRLAARRAALLRRLHGLEAEPFWHGSISGFEASAAEEARRLGVYVSTRRDVEASRNQTVMARIQ